MALNDGHVDQTARLQGEQIAAYERRGPFWGRLTQSAVVVVCAASLVASRRGKGRRSGSRRGR
ncbi:hypothetical protein DDE19_34720 [Micromonospora ureilytica]|uniref:Uncharacterized protein n=1 Tax=Micromonospora ureilytica TaxID=709868 RepID=A0A3N9X6E1_9ACTN|nr:hypothetical protein DDE19_34720 [Micromonospora ureilytica]